MPKPMSARDLQRILISQENLEVELAVIGWLTDNSLGDKVQKFADVWRLLINATNNADVPTTVTVWDNLIPLVPIFQPVSSFAVEQLRRSDVVGRGVAVNLNATVLTGIVPTPR